MPSSSSLIELLGTVGGSVAAAFGALKFAVPYVLDQTLNRKAAKTATEIDTLLGRLINLEDQKGGMQALNLESYKLEVQENIQAKLRLLDAIRAKRQQRALSRNEEPKGVGRWLLFYRPDGFDGLLVQLTYYIAAFTALDIAIVGVAMFPDLDRGAIVVVVVVALLVAAVALYARSVSLRMKSVGNKMRLEGIGNPNNDLGWLRRNLLILKRADDLWGQRFWYYVLLFIAVSGPFIEQQKGRNLSWWEEVYIVTAYLLLAQVVKAHALLRRGSLKMGNETKHEEVRTAESTPD